MSDDLLRVCFTHEVGMGNLDPDRSVAMNDDEIQVTIHGKYGRGPMPVEFRDALVEMVRLVKQGIDDGTTRLPAAPRQRALTQQER